jgi:hypothetical protein
MAKRPFFGGVVKQGSIGSAFAWWYLSKKQKQILEEQRQAGRFGGESAKGVGKAPYFWAQEYGEPKAMIEAQGVVTEAVEDWRMEANEIVASFIRS